MAVDISVIITSYNVAPYIRTAIDSALAQTGVRLEVIVVDDASTDETWHSISSYNDPRLRSIQLETNAGPGAARNAGFAAATGEWIAILDGDDQFLPNRLERCLFNARSTSADIIVDNLLTYREEDGATAPMFPPQQFNKLTTLTLPALIRETLTWRGGYRLGYLKPIFNRTWLEKQKLRYQTDLRIGEDYMLLADALALGARCTVEPTPGYRYTVRRGSISHRLSIENLMRIIAADTAFTTRHTLSAEALRAQRRRRFLHHEYLAYLKLIEALKSHRGSQALQAALACPTSLRHLWQPLAKRLARVAGWHKTASRQY